jgi:D-glycero-D-manno-heptose 1,7-bisphosphate phosphatase
MNRGGIFLDRDGTINREVEYLSSPDELELLPGSAQAIRLANELGFKVIIVTNQSGVARGFFTEETLQLIHDRLLAMLAAENARIDAIYYCPHHPELGVGKYKTDCSCRKPKTEMADKAVAQFNLDPRESYVIGDRMADVELARNIGAHPILVKTGYGNDELALCRSRNIQMEYVAEDLLDAVRYVERRQRIPHASIPS